MAKQEKKSQTANITQIKAGVEIPKEMSAWIDANHGFLKKPGFKIKDIKDIEGSITYRQVNSWEKYGLIKPERVGSEKGWRLFSFCDIVSILLIKNLKEFGLSSTKIKVTIDHLQNEKKYKNKDITSIDLNILFTLSGKEVGLLIFEKSNPVIAPIEVLFEIFKTINIWRYKYIYIPFSSYITQILDAGGLKLDYGGNYNPPFIDPRLRNLIELIKNKDYREIRVYTQDGGIKRIGALSSISGEFSENDVLDSVNKNDYQKIELIKKDGKIVSISREESIKP